MHPVREPNIYADSGNSYINPLKPNFNFEFLIVLSLIWKTIKSAASTTGGNFKIGMAAWGRK
jgi:hypothetical protein